MANKVMASISLVLFDLSSANAGVGLPEKVGTTLVALPEYEFESEITTKAIVLPIGNLEFLKSLPVNGPEISEPKEDQNSKPDDENETRSEVSTESVVKAGHPSDSDSVPFTVINLSHKHRNCRHKLWFRELPHRENEYGKDESFNKDEGEDVSLDSVILHVMHFDQGHGNGNWKKHSSMPHRGHAGIINRVQGFKRLDDQEPEEEKMESKQKEAEKPENEAREGKGRLRKKMKKQKLCRWKRRQRLSVRKSWKSGVYWETSTNLVEEIPQVHEFLKFQL